MLRGSCDAQPCWQHDARLLGHRRLLFRVWGRMMLLGGIWPKSDWSTLPTPLAKSQLQCLTDIGDGSKIRRSTEVVLMSAV